MICTGTGDSKGGAGPQIGGRTGGGRVGQPVGGGGRRTRGGGGTGNTGGAGEKQVAGREVRSSLKSCLFYKKHKNIY